MVLERLPLLGTVITGRKLRSRYRVSKGFSLTGCEAAVCCGLGMGIELAGQRYSSYNCPVLLFPYLISTLYSFSQGQWQPHSNHNFASLSP